MRNKEWTIVSIAAIVYATICYGISLIEIHPAAGVTPFMAHFIAWAGLAFVAGIPLFLVIKESLKWEEVDEDD